VRQKGTKAEEGFGNEKSQSPLGWMLDLSAAKRQYKTFQMECPVSAAGVPVKFDCHPEQAFFAQRRICASRAMCLLSDTIIACLARFLIKLHHYPAGPEAWLQSLCKGTFSYTRIQWLRTLACNRRLSASNTSLFEGCTGMWQSMQLDAVRVPNFRTILH